MPRPMLALQLAQLVEHKGIRLDTLPAVGAPSGRPPFERLDSAQMSVGGIILSRLVHMRDPEHIVALAGSPYGASMLARVMKLFSDAAVTAGATTFTQSNATSLFRMTGSTLSRAASYQGTVLRDRLSHNAAKQIYSNILDAITAVRALPVGTQTCAVLLGDQQTAMMADNEVERVLVDFVAACRVHLGLQLVQPQVEQPIAPDPSAAPRIRQISLAGKFVDHVASQLIAIRPLTPVETQLVVGALGEAADRLRDSELASMIRGGAVSFGHVLATPAGAQIWASSLGALGAQPTHVPTWCDRLVAACSMIVSLGDVSDAIDALDTR